jgi:simple sugar transport system permease protein
MGIRLQTRKDSGTKVSLIIILIGFGLSIFSFSIVFLFAGINPLVGFQKIFKGGFGDAYVIQQVLKDTAPLLFVTLAFLLPSRAGLWNIGAEGQFFLGGVGATGVSLAFPTLPPIVLLPLMALGAIACSGAWAFIPAYLKAKFEINEIVLTLFLNWIALLLVKYLTVGGPWMNPEGRSESVAIPPAGRIPNVFQTDVPYTIFFAVIAAILLYLIFQKTRAGFEIKAYGHNPVASVKAGIDAEKVILISFAVGGVLAGLGGFHQSAAVIGRLRYDLTAGWGYYGILFALLSKNNPLGAIIVTFLATGLLVSGVQSLQFDLGMGGGVGLLFVGVIILCFVIPQFLKEYKVSWK